MTATTHPEARILVLCYSRTGNTRVVGQAIASALGAEFEELQTVEPGAGPRSYSRCALDILFRRRVKLAPLAHNPAEFALVVIGTPVWMASVSSPVRSLLRVMRSRLPHIAVFLTHGGTSKERVFEQLESLAAQTPLARLAVTERAVMNGEITPLVEQFAEEIRAQLPRLTTVHAAGG